MTTSQNFGTCIPCFSLSVTALALSVLDLTIYALQPEAHFDLCAQRMRYDTFKQAEHRWRSLPFHIYGLLHYDLEN